jgi:hypothetical protein
MAASRSVSEVVAGTVWRTTTVAPRLAAAAAAPSMNRGRHLPSATAAHIRVAARRLGASRYSQPMSGVTLVSLNEGCPLSSTMTVSRLESSSNSAASTPV